ncbi:MAG: hypothetical protein WCF23_22735 [Candidatus Nitrosopolaris sp.]
MPRLLTNLESKIEKQLQLYDEIKELEDEDDDFTDDRLHYCQGRNDALIWMLINLE